MDEQFKHATAVQSLLDDGKLQEAVELHNAHIKEQFERARAGETIDLTDLMAAKETLYEVIHAGPHCFENQGRTP